MSNYVITNISHDLIENNADDKCFICFETDDKLIKPCKCEGTNYSVHRKCLSKWISTSRKDYCQVCNYQYKYESIFCPSYDRFHDKNCLCISEDEDENEESQDYIENDTNYIFFFSLFFYVPIYLILTTSLFFKYELLLGLYWSLFFIQPLFYLVLKFKLDFKIDIQKIVRNTQLLLCFVTFIVINVIVAEFETRCNINCRYEKKICDNNCSYFNHLEKARNNRVFLVDNRLMTFGFTLLLDMLYRLKDCCFYFRIAEYKDNLRISSSKIYPFRRNN